MAGKNYKKMKNHEDKNIPNGCGDHTDENGYKWLTNNMHFASC